MLAWGMMALITLHLCSDRHSEEDNVPTKTTSSDKAAPTQEVCSIDDDGTLTVADEKGNVRKINGPEDALLAKHISVPAHPPSHPASMLSS